MINQSTKEKFKAESGNEPGTIWLVINGVTSETNERNDFNNLRKKL